MSTIVNEPEMKSVKSLLSGDKYLIPMYQRNYSWGESHLRQLIQDVYDCCKSQRNYYIGTLVVHLREDGMYETVDGQQRLTTLNIILCALRNEMDDMFTNENGFEWFKCVNISYEYRERSSQTLEALYLYASDDNLNDADIVNMYHNVCPNIESIVPTEDRKCFIDYLLNRVIVTRVVLPADTDLNHYFEIMNSRGEQLEKPEILKALLMRSSAQDLHKSWLIGQIWEACADMDRYVPMNFTSRLRDIIFGDKWDTFEWSSLDELIENAKDDNQNITNEQFSINDVINGYGSSMVGDKCSETESDRFESIIKFQGFLLQVLRVLTKEDIPLDDKRLLQTFDAYLWKPSFADEFILKMLELRFLYDRFVIKRDYKDDAVNGSMNLFTLTRQEKGFSYNLTFDSDENKRVSMVESMFHASLPSQNYKHWLCAVLNYIDEHKQGDGLGTYLEALAKTYMFGRFISKETTSDGFYYTAIFHRNNIKLQKPISSLPFPTYTEHVDFFVFNYIDYCIWKKNPKEYSNFEFTSRSSVEHFYPQHPLSSQVMDDNHLHDIGNLCLISSSKNSELSNYSPSAKTEHYGKVGYDSLKQKLMMDVVNGNKNKNSDTEKIWWIKDVEEHHKEIENIVIESYDILGL